MGSFTTKWSWARSGRAIFQVDASAHDDGRMLLEKIAKPTNENSSAQECI